MDINETLKCKLSFTSDIFHEFANENNKIFEKVIIHSRDCTDNPDKMKTK